MLAFPRPNVTSLKTALFVQIHLRDEFQCYDSPLEDKDHGAGYVPQVTPGRFRRVLQDAKND